MGEFFEFESDFVDSLRCIPMQVRFYLDTCGIKLKLADWNHMTTAERETLVELPCTTASEIQAYREYVQKLVTERSGTAAGELPVEANPAWADSNTIPGDLQNKVKEIGATLTLQQWAELTELQRFALIKLSRSGHENRNFPKAMSEFNLFETK